MLGGNELPTPWNASGPGKVRRGRSRSRRLSSSRFILNRAGHDGVIGEVRRGLQGKWPKPTNKNLLHGETHGVVPIPYLGSKKPTVQGADVIKLLFAVIK